ncbi:MAG: thioredoxin family protein [Candidatus Buchananbacteria bacterium]|nr:thioredoxin family protein [Candidatus Buchananbacteria bacterium]
MKILKIGADWCPECIIMRLRFTEIEKDMPDLQTEFIDIDKNPEIKKARNIEDIPTFIFLDKNGQEILRLQKLIEKEDLIKIIKENYDK